MDMYHFKHTKTPICFQRLLSVGLWHRFVWYKCADPMMEVTGSSEMSAHCQTTGHHNLNNNIHSRFHENLKPHSDLFISSLVGVWMHTSAARIMETSKICTKLIPPFTKFHTAMCKLKTTKVSSIHNIKYGHSLSAVYTSSVNISWQMYLTLLHSSNYKNLQLQNVTVNISLGRDLLFPPLRNKKDITLKSVSFHRMNISTNIWKWTS